MPRNRSFNSNGIHPADLFAAVDPSIAGARTIAHLHRLEGPPPCFFWRVCRGTAACCKQGKAVCDVCAAGLPGASLPLQDPRAFPPYTSPRACATALDMIGFCAL